MKRSIFSSISVFVVALASAASANAAPQTTPFNLVDLARNGYFKEQGIPSHAALGTAFASGRINAQDVIRAAIEQNRVAPEAINDEGYLRQVNTKLDDLVGD
jgi:hypothetical protein